MEIDLEIVCLVWFILENIQMQNFFIDVGDFATKNLNLYYQLQKKLERKTLR